MDRYSGSMVSLEKKSPVFSTPANLVQASAHAENEGVNELLRHCCHSSCSANRNSRIVTGGKVRAAKRLPRKSHTCLMGLRSVIVPVNPYVQNPHSLRAVRQLLCDDMVHCRQERNCRPIAPLKDAHMEEESRYNNGSR
ncbi:hypothetical protein TNCV_231581 [Trichonephila clavipes]|nr:hypothetical protein TNCV_231581 [Trichonephila clavipes]